MNRIMMVVFGLLVASASFSQTNSILQSATAALPEQLRDGATVVQRLDGGVMNTIREGTNGLTCFSDAPGGYYQVVCMGPVYYEWDSRLIELRRAGMSMNDATARTLQEMENGTLEQFVAGSIAYYLTGPDESELRLTLLLMMPYATEQSTGLQQEPKDVGAWLMCPGGPGAHLMIGAQQYGASVSGISIPEFCGTAESSN